MTKFKMEPYLPATQATGESRVSERIIENDRKQLEAAGARHKTEETNNKP